jgi:ABC-type polysaccharide/polyol phosphate transport system ATPase subunit
MEKKMEKDKEETLKKKKMDEKSIIMTPLSNASSSGSLSQSVDSNSPHEKEKGRIILQDISFNVKKGSLIMIVGTIGSGKSSIGSGMSVIVFVFVPLRLHEIIYFFFVLSFL